MKPPIFFPFDSVLDSRAEVNTRINARNAVLGGRLGKARERTSHAGKWGAACDREGHMSLRKNRRNTSAAAPPRTL